MLHGSGSILIGESVVAPCKAPLRDDYNMVVDSSLTILNTWSLLGSMFTVQMSGIGTRPERDMPLNAF